MTIRVRRARAEDMGDVALMDEQCFPADSRVSTSSPATLWWVATIGGRHVGFASADAWMCDGEKALIFTRAGVVPEGRGQGVQSALIRARLRHGARQGFDEAWTYTSHANVASANNLIRCGFRMWLPAHWGGYEKPWTPRGGYAWLYWRRKL